MTRINKELKGFEQDENFKRIPLTMIRHTYLNYSLFILPFPIIILGQSFFKLINWSRNGMLLFGYENINFKLMILNIFNINSLKRKLDSSEYVENRIITFYNSLGLGKIGYLVNRVKKARPVKITFTFRMFI